MARILQI